MKLEIRFMPAEIRATGGDAPKIAGYVTKFDALSQVIYDFREKFAPGCFDDCLAQNPDILGLFNHKTDYVLGRTSSGTMRVKVDATGLAYEIDPPATQLGRDLLVSMGRGDIRGSSIGFYCLEESWDLDPSTGGLIRTIVKAAVFDISVVTDPAYLTSDAQIRSRLAEGEQALRALVERKRQELSASDGPGWSMAEMFEMHEQLELDEIATL